VWDDWDWYQHRVDMITISGIIVQQRKI